jgi:hypothetical protein
VWGGPCAYVLAALVLKGSRLCASGVPRAQITTLGSVDARLHALDTTLAVHRGIALSTLVPVASNDDCAWGSNGRGPSEPTLASNSSSPLPLTSHPRSSLLSPLGRQVRHRPAFTRV